MTQAFREIARRIQGSSQDPAAVATLHDLIEALDGPNGAFDLMRLYQLNFQDFELAMELITDWRFRRITRPGTGLREQLAHA